MYEKMRQMKIAVIDDDRYLLDSIFVYFDFKGCPIKAFDNVGAAWKAISSEPFDLIICDYIMPDMDGITLLKHAAEMHPATIRVLVTAYPRQEILTADKRKIYDDLIQKPLTIAKLETSLRKLLGIDLAKGSVA